jgi:hypothetical protein
MDNGGRITERVEIKGINEPCQLAWDGKGLWISSWFDRRVYNVDVDTMEIKGHFPTQIRQTTGIAWDGESFWVTGTEADLYQFRLGG